MMAHVAIRCEQRECVMNNVPQAKDLPQTEVRIDFWTWLLGGGTGSTGGKG